MEHKVLLVDDDARFLDAYKRDLKDEFNITTSLGDVQGFAEINEHGPYAVVVSDLNLPGMDGIQFLSRVKELSPETVCVLLAGQDDLETAIQAINSGNIFRFLTKPFKHHVLAKTINAGLRQFTKNRQTAQEIEKTDSPISVKKILIVDDDPIVRSILSSALKTHKELGVLTAENGKVAVKLLNIIKIDLVITDMEMPEMNGVGLLSYMNKDHPEIPVIVLTWFVTKEFESKIKALGASQYLEKPIDVDIFTETIFQELNAGAGGKIHGISIAAFLQLVEMEEKTCTLTVKWNHRVGYLYFLKGGLIGAVSEDLRGEEAAYRIIGWENSAIEIEDVCRNKKKEINKPLMLILMEANRLKDEEGAGITATYGYNEEINEALPV
jgi:DNA-binding NtrC family response regulator